LSRAIRIDSDAKTGELIIAKTDNTRATSERENAEPECVMLHTLRLLAPHSRNWHYAPVSFSDDCAQRLVAMPERQALVLRVFLAAPPAEALSSLERSFGLNRVLAGRLLHRAMVQFESPGAFAQSDEVEMAAALRLVNSLEANDSVGLGEMLMRMRAEHHAILEEATRLLRERASSPEAVRTDALKRAGILFVVAVAFVLYAKEKFGSQLEALWIQLYP
jgi:hypothetical protein